MFQLKMQTKKKKKGKQKEEKNIELVPKKKPGLKPNSSEKSSSI
jgi:hypothetical protein